MPALSRVLVGVLALVVLAAGGVLVFHATLPEDDLDTVRPGGLRVAGDVEGQRRLGPVTVRVSAASGLVVEEEGRTVWAADPGLAFVTAARGDVDWEEHRGYFWPTVHLRERLTTQSVEEVRADRSRVVITGSLSGDGSGGGEDAAYSLTLTRRAAGGVVADLVVEDGVDSVALVSGRTRHAGVHGFGEQFTDFDLDGRLLPIVAREQGVGRGEQPLTFLADLTNHGAGGTEDMTYAAWSSFVTDDLRGVRLDPDLADSHAFAVADTRDPDRVGLEVWAPHLRAELTSGARPVDLLAEQHGSTRRGTRPALAPWTQRGSIVGLQGGTDRVRREVAELEAAGTEISGVWLQDWTGQRTTSFGDRLWWTWQLDRGRYPGWEELVSDLAVKGIRTTTYVNPFLTDAADKDGTDKDSTDKDSTDIRNLHAEAEAAGFLVEDGEGSPYELDQGGFDAALVDLTDPAARHWFAAVIAEEVLAAGVSGFMADFGEGLPFDAVVDRGSAATAHNRWPQLWARTVREACRLADRPGCVTWFRSGSLGMDRETPLFWNGDQLVDFGAEDGLASALLGSLSAGVSGWPLIHSDIGGYTSIDAKLRDYTRPADLLQRWAEYAAFGVVMRTHEGNRPAENAQVYDSEDSEKSFARMTRVFAALAPYRRTVLAEATRTGVPAIRHGWLVVPGTPAADVDTQFFLGSSILVAPVLEADAVSVRVTFPPGRWIHLLTGEEYDGDRTTTVDAPLGTPAAFVREDDPRAPGLLAALRSA